MARNKTKKKPIKERNWLAVRAHSRGGAGSHRNRDEAIRRGSSRKRKHAGRKDW